MSDEAVEALALLRAAHADAIDHPGGTLLAHLQRTSALLAAWDARPALVTAGLCHVFYGTDGFATALLPLDRRAELAAAIGEEAESLVYFYASCAREPSYPRLADPEGEFTDRFTRARLVPTLGQRRDFAELTAANELDIVAVSPEVRARFAPALRQLLTAWHPLLSAPARRHTRTVLG